MFSFFVQGYVNFLAYSGGTTQTQPEIRIEDNYGTYYYTGTSSLVGWSSGLTVVGKFTAQLGTQTFYLKARNYVATANYKVGGNGLFVQGIRR